MTIRNNDKYGSSSISIDAEFNAYKNSECENKPLLGYWCFLEGWEYQNPSTLCAYHDI